MSQEIINTWMKHVKVLIKIILNVGIIIKATLILKN